MNLINIKLPHYSVDKVTNVQSNNNIINNYLRFGFQILGIDFNSPNFKMNLNSVMLLAVSHPVVLSFVFLLCSNESLSVKLEGTCSFIILWQGIYKFWCTVVSFKNYFRAVQSLSALHGQYVNDLAIAPELKRICFYFFVIAEILVGFYVMVAMTYLLLPLLMWLIYDEQVTIIPIPFPLLGWRSVIGYTINMVHQTCLIFYGLIGIIALDCMFLYQILHTIGYLNIFDHRVKQLNETIENNPENLHSIEHQLYESIKAHQEYISSIEMVDENYSTLCLGQLMSSQFGIIVALFMTLWSNWIVAPFITVAGIFQLLEYCILGTVVTIQNEKASEIIYDMRWYSLPARLQKLVIPMIARGQNSPELTVGGFGKLNVETAMRILTGTYQYLMMMLKFIK